jgi:CubicO group peptidase (beta-lactamase class C family)
MTPLRAARSCCIAFAAFFLAVASRAQDPFATVPGVLQPFVTQGEISGAVALVATKDRVLHLSAIGQSDLSTGRAMQPDDVFWIASMTKPIAAVSVALLVDDGRLSFDDPVEKFLPEFRRPWVIEEQEPDRRVLVQATRPITIRDVMTHTSGLGEYATTDPHWTLATMSRVLAREPLRFQPGTRWGYSTAGTDLLGRIAEVVAGVPYAAFVQKRLFEPLGMKDTTFWLGEAQEKRFARNYRPNPQTGRLEEATIDYMYGGKVTDAARPPLGGAGLFSTAGDIARFYQMMLNDGMAGGQRILKVETVAEITRKQTGELRARPGMPWGLGFCVIEDPGQMEANATLSPGSFGHGGAHGTNSWADPKRGLVYVFMIQRAALRPNPDNSSMRRAYQEAVETALIRTSEASRGR